MGRSIGAISAAARKAGDSFLAGNAPIQRKYARKTCNNVCEKISSDNYVSPVIKVRGFSVSQLPSSSNIIRYDQRNIDKRNLDEDEIQDEIRLEPEFKVKVHEYFIDYDDYENQHGNAYHDEFGVVVGEDEYGHKTLQIFDKKGTDDVWLSIDLSVATVVNSLFASPGITIAYYMSTGTDQQSSSISFCSTYLKFSSGKIDLHKYETHYGPMRLYFQCSNDDLSQLLQIFNSWRCTKQFTRPYPLESEAALCLGQYFNRSKKRISYSMDTQKKVICFSAHTLGLPICARMITDIAKTSWLMLHKLIGMRDNSQKVDSYSDTMYHRTRYSHTECWRTFYYDEKSILCLRRNNWLGDYTVGLWAIMISIYEPSNVRVCFPQFYQGLVHDIDTQNYGLLDSQQRKERLFLIPICDNTHWTLAVVYVESSGNYSIITLDSMKPKLCKNEEEVETNLGLFFGCKIYGKRLVVNEQLRLFFENVPGQCDSDNCGVYVCLYAYWIAKNSGYLISLIDSNSAKKKNTPVDISFGDYVKSVKPDVFRCEYTSFIRILNSRINDSGIAATTLDNFMLREGRRKANKKLAGNTNHSLIKSKEPKKSEPVSPYTPSPTPIFRKQMKDEKTTEQSKHTVHNNTKPDGQPYLPDLSSGPSTRSKLKTLRRKQKLPINVRTGNVPTKKCNGEDDDIIRRSKRTKKKNEEGIYLYSK